MSENALAGIPTEGDEIAAVENKDEVGKETPAESPAEKNQTETKPPQEGEKNTPDDSNLPFHKHPRWKEMHDENARLKEEISSIRDDVQTRFSTLEKEKETVNVPSWFSKLYGENQEAWEAYQEHITAERELIKSDLMREREEEHATATAEQKRWETWVANGLEKIEEKNNVDLHSKTEEAKRKDFLKFTYEYLPTDSDGSVDFEKSWELYNKLNTNESSEKARARKAIASKTTSDDRAETKPSDILTPSQIRAMGWLGLGE